MASVVDTSVKHFHSGQVGAPVLTGAAGSMIALLDACLVNGFGLKSVTSLVVAGGVATITVAGTNSAVVDSVILVAGVTGALTALNGEQKVTATAVVGGDSTIRFATAAADGTAAGTITVKQASARWSKAFAGTNLAAYRSDDVTSNRRFVRIADTATHRSRIHVYENMTAVSSGTGPMPTSGQVSGGAYLPKLAPGFPTASASGWAIFSNGKRVFLFVADYLSQGAGYTAGFLLGWGDFPSFKSGDTYNTFLCAGIASDISHGLALLGFGAGGAQMWIQRLHTGAANARTAGKYSVGDGNVAGAGPWGPMPAPAGGGLYLVPSWLSCDEIGTYGLRGALPALWQSPQTIAPGVLAHGDIVPGVGATAGRRLFALRTTGSSGDTSFQLGSFIDITGPWAGD